MTAPRRVLLGTTYLVTRRCFQRQFLLRPSPLTNHVFRYVLGVAAQRFGIQLHAYCVLSNHFHIVLTDPQARLPAFEQLLDSLVARALNAALGRWESFWAPGSFSAVALVEPADVVEKAAYTLANPVSAGLTTRGREWEGLWSPPEEVGTGPVAVDRPAFFFRPKGPLPSSVPLELTPPPGFTAEEFRERLADALAAREGGAAGAGEVGPDTRAGARAAPTLDQGDPAGLAHRPATREPRRRLRPALAARDKIARLEALALLAAFRGAYREAWAAFCRGVRDAVFPAGTYLLRVRQGVRCAAPG